MQTIARVKKYIDENFLLNENEKVIIGVSGGADSMALLDILLQLGYDCVVAHCNFHLRGSESDRDYLFVKNYCKSNKIEFISVDFDTQKHMDSRGISLEMAARELRYKWFEEICIEYGATKVAVAHHRDDSVETVLINLVRGTGIRGLTGISPRNGNVVRPLLGLSREEIINYLNGNGIDYVEDSTNNENIYTRNKIRLEVIPLLETLNPSVKEAIERTAGNLLSVEKIYSSAIAKSIENVYSSSKINIELLLKENEPDTVLYEILYPLGFSVDTIQDIYKSVNNQSGKIFHSDSYTLIKDRESFILEKKEEKDTSVYVLDMQQDYIEDPIKLKIQEYTKDSSFQIEKSSDTIYLDKSKLSLPLIIRRWKKGDRFMPFGMKGYKKLSDYFSDNKFSLIEKENVWLLCSGSDIVWIIGHRADNRFRVTDNTTKIIQIDQL